MKQSQLDMLLKFCNAIDDADAKKFAIGEVVKQCLQSETPPTLPEVTENFDEDVEKVKKRNIARKKTKVTTKKKIEVIEPEEPEEEKELPSSPVISKSAAAKSAPAKKSKKVGRPTGGKNKTPDRSAPDKAPVSVEPTKPIGFNALLSMFYVRQSSKKAKLLNKLIEKAKDVPGGKGIPCTRDSESYNFVRMAGKTPPQTVHTSFANEKVVLTPALFLKGIPPECYALWMQFELLLLGIEQIQYSKKKTNNMRIKIQNDPFIAKARITSDENLQWVEEIPDRADDGIPPIPAQMARDYILEVIPKAYKYLIQSAPLGWYQEDGHYSTKLRQMMQEIWLEEIKVGRKGKFMLSRLFMVPLGKVERHIQNVAFPRKKNVKQ